MRCALLLCLLNPDNILITAEPVLYLIASITDNDIHLFHVSFPADYFNTPIDDLPLMNDVKNYNDVGLVVTMSGSTFPDFWVAYAHERYGQEIAAGVTAVMAADYYPYLQTGQLVGLIGGLKGAAEYEKLINRPSDGLKGMDAQTIVHLFIVLMIILGNLAYIFAQRARNREAA